MMRSERGSRRLYGVMLTLAAVVVLLDQLTKLWAVSALSETERVPVIPPLIHFRLLHNPGAAFSLGTGVTWVFTLVAAGAVGGILYTARRLASPGWAIVLGALLGG
ncbi:signal peptidase II, partial [Streptosporangium algeriense]